MDRLHFFLEKWGPLAFSFIAVLMWYFYFCAPFPKNPTNVLMASISVGAIVTGFLSTTEGILLTLNPKSKVITNLFKSKHLISIISYLSRTITVGILFSLFSLLSLIHESVITDNLLFQIIWIFLASFLFSSFYRITQIIIKILKLDPSLR